MLLKEFASGQNAGLAWNVVEEREVFPNLLWTPAEQDSALCSIVGAAAAAPGAQMRARIRTELLKMLSLLVFIAMSQRVRIPSSIKWGTQYQGQGYSCQDHRNSADGATKTETKKV